jgi:hypothetical protein
MTQDDILKAQHNDWLCHPLTLTMLKRFEELRASHIQKSIAQSSDMNVDDKEFRLSAYAVKTIDRMTTVINDRNKMIPIKPE